MIIPHGAMLAAEGEAARKNVWKSLGSHALLHGLDVVSHTPKLQGLATRGISLVQDIRRARVPVTRLPDTAGSGP